MVNTPTRQHSVKCWSSTHPNLIQRFLWSQLFFFESTSNRLTDDDRNYETCSVMHLEMQFCKLAPRQPALFRRRLIGEWFQNFLPLRDDNPGSDGYEILLKVRSTFLLIGIVLLFRSVCVLVIVGFSPWTLRGNEFHKIRGALFVSVTIYDSNDPHVRERISFTRSLQAGLALQFKSNQDGQVWKKNIKAVLVSLGFSNSDSFCARSIGRSRNIEIQLAKAVTWNSFPAVTIKSN